MDAEDFASGTTPNRDGAPALPANLLFQRPSSIRKYDLESNDSKCGFRSSRRADPLSVFGQLVKCCLPPSLLSLYIISVKVKSKNRILFFAVRFLFWADEYALDLAPSSERVPAFLRMH